MTRLSFRLSLAAMAFIGAVLRASSAAAGVVAITFDDVPGLMLGDNQSYQDTFNRDLLQVLVRRHVPATGFVVGRDLAEGQPGRRRAIVKAWRAAGMTIGDHTYSHERPEVLGTARYTADIARCEAALRALTSGRARGPLWFRPPELATGATPAARRAISAWLTRHGYRLAPVTLETSDWMFSEPYDDALAKGELDRARDIRTRYLIYTRQRIDWARRAGKALFGRDIAQIMLLHDSRLNADSLDDVLDLLDREGLRPVALAEAMRDAAYRTPARPTGGDGDNWLERWSVALHKDLPDGDDDPPAEIQAQYDRVDSDRH